MRGLVLCDSCSTARPRAAKQLNSLDRAKQARLCRTDRPGSRVARCSSARCSRHVLLTVFARAPLLLLPFMRSIDHIYTTWYFLGLTALLVRGPRQ